MSNFSLRQNYFKTCLLNILKKVFIFIIGQNMIANNDMNILVVGGGGREHALAWKIAQSPSVKKVFVAPGNAGTALEPKVENVNATSIEQLLSFAQKYAIDLTIIGPETMLEQGIVDQFKEHGFYCFGPTQKAAQLETSKLYAKEFMIRHHIPTATYKSFNSFLDACHYIEHQQTFPVIIKADGLAGGKGVIIAHTKKEAIEAAHDMLIKKNFGSAGQTIIIEEYLEGEEATFIVITDGLHILPLASSQDHKKLYDGDKGPNTGGMGAYSPAPVITPELHEYIMSHIVEPTISGMAQEGIPYTGFLYVGLMINSNNEPKVLEYNCRLGDPEAQSILMRLQTDLVTLCTATIDKKLDTIQMTWNPQVSLGVVLATQNYPFALSPQEIIQGLEKIQDSTIKIFHATTKREGNSIVTAGGRVLCVTVLADTFTQAQKKVYNAIQNLSWSGMIYRTDIGHNACRREQL